MLHLRVVIDKGDGNTKYSRGFPAWEIPVLQYLFGAPNVTLTGESEKVMDLTDGSKDREYPDAQSEYERLSGNYGKDPDDQSFVSRVYGNGPLGLRELQRAIDAAKRDEVEEDKAIAAEAPKPKPAPVVKRNRRVPASTEAARAMLS